MRKRALTPYLSLSNHLLDMLYRPSELAKELGCPLELIQRVYLPADCPRQRDETGHIWINGHLFRDWLRNTWKVEKRRTQLADNQSFCVVCRKAVVYAPTGKHIGNNRAVTLEEGICAECGHLTYRARRAE